MRILVKYKFPTLFSLITMVLLGVYLNTTPVPIEEGWPFEADENSVDLVNPQCSYEENNIVTCSADALYPGVANLTPSQFINIELNTSAKRMNGSVISPISRLLSSLRIEIILLLIIELYNQKYNLEITIETLPESFGYECNQACIDFLEENLGEISEVTDAILGKYIILHKENLPEENSRFDYRLNVSICSPPNPCQDVEQILYKKGGDGSLSIFRSENNFNGQHMTSIMISPKINLVENEVTFTFRWEYVSAPPDLNDDGEADFEEQHGFHVYRGMAETWPMELGTPASLDGGTVKTLFLTGRIGSSKGNDQHRSHIYTLARDGEGNFSVVFKPVDSNEAEPESNFKGCFQQNFDTSELEFSSVEEVCDSHNTFGLETTAVENSYSLVASTNWDNETPSDLDFTKLSFSCKNFEVTNEGNSGCNPLLNINNMGMEFNEEVNDAKINNLKCLYDNCKIEFGFFVDCNNLTGEEEYSDFLLGELIGYNEAVEQWESLGEENNPGRCLALKAINMDGPEYLDELDGKLINPYRFYIDSAGGVDLPECEEGPYFTHSPISEDDIKGIVPLGAYNPPGHVFATDHIYIYVPDTDEQSPGADATNIYSPGNITITSISSYLNVTHGFTDYQITLHACKGYSLEFGHVQGLSDKLNEELDNAKDSGSSICNTYETGGVTYESCSYPKLKIEVLAGDYLGWVGGNPTMMALDIWAKDLSAEPKTFATSYGQLSKRKSQYGCPLDEFTLEIKEMLESHLGSYDGTKKRTIEPVCGEFAQDIAGTAQGHWFLLGQENSSHEDPHLFLGHDNVDPTIGVFSTGISFEVIGSSEHHFEPTFDGVFNRDFSEVTSDGLTYCYSTNPYFEATQSPGAILIKMADEVTLLVEHREDFECSSAETYEIDEGAAIIFIR